MCRSCFSRERALGHSTTKPTCFGCIGAHTGTILVAIICCTHDPVSWILAPLMIFGLCTQQAPLYWGFLIWRGLFATASLLFGVLILTPLSILFASGVIWNQKGDEDRASPGAILGIFLIVPASLIALAWLNFYTCYVIPLRSKSLIEDLTGATIVGPVDSDGHSPHTLGGVSQPPLPTTTPGDTSYPYVYAPQPSSNPAFAAPTINSQFPPSPNAL